jgi:hypothetical protein
MAQKPEDEQSRPGWDERKAELAEMRSALQRGRDSLSRAKRMLDKLNRRPKAAPGS